MTVQDIGSETFVADWTRWHREHELAVDDIPVHGTHHFPPIPERGSVYATAGDAVIDGLQHVYESPGVVTFTVEGEPLRLTAFHGGAPGSLSILFTDGPAASSVGRTTFHACRALSVDPPDDDGTVTLDFNRAVNLPAAYTDFATCPLPPAENRLSVPVEAGELIFHNDL
jgi:uncharacterized protein (DUF1684 family)